MFEIHPCLPQLIPWCLYTGMLACLFRLKWHRQAIWQPRALQHGTHWQAWVIVQLSRDKLLEILHYSLTHADLWAGPYIAGQVSKLSCPSIIGWDSNGRKLMLKFVSWKHPAGVAGSFNLDYHIYGYTGIHGTRENFGTGVSFWFTHCILKHKSVHKAFWNTPISPFPLPCNPFPLFGALGNC